MLIDLPPGTGDIHLSIMQSLPVTERSCSKYTAAVALADAKKGSINVLSRQLMFLWNY
jgi:ATP-binding protein involved in chromosome partitioning